MAQDNRAEASTETHKPARPLKFFKDKDGNGWLCDKDIDIDGDLEGQGCWRSLTRLQAGCLDECRE